MSPAKKIAANTLFQIAGKVVTTTLGIIITALLTRYLGPEQFGQYIFAGVFVTLFGSIGDWGLTLITVREASKNGARAAMLIGNVLVIRLLLAAAAAAAANLAIRLFPNAPQMPFYVAIVSLSLLLLSLKTSFQIIFNVKLQMQNWAVSELATNLTVLALVLVLIARQAPLSSFLWAFNVGHLAAAAVAGLLAFRLLPLSFSLVRPETKYLLAEALPMGTILILFTVYNRIDTVILGYFHGSSAVGIYGVAYRVFEVLVLGAAYFANSVLPVISRLAATDKTKLAAVFKKSLFVLSILGVGAAVGNFILAPLAIFLVGGAEYLAAVTPLQILSLALIVSYFNHLHGYTLIALGKQWASLKIAAVALAINVVLNFLLIPRFSYNGAALTTFLTEGLIVMLSLAVIRKELWHDP